jgi:hypothetical protein
MDDFSFLSIMRLACNEFTQVQDSTKEQQPIPENDIFNRLQKPAQLKQGVRDLSNQAIAKLRLVMYKNQIAGTQ